MFLFLCFLSLNPPLPTPEITSVQNNLGQQMSRISWSLGNVIDKNRCHAFTLDVSILEKGQMVDQLQHTYYPGPVKEPVFVFDYPLEKHQFVKMKLRDCRMTPIVEAEGDSRSFTAGTSLSYKAVFPFSGHNLKIFAPTKKLLLNKVAVTAKVEGDGVSKVIWKHNGEQVAVAELPPYEARIRLGGRPEMHELEAIAIDFQDKVLARDQITLNQGPAHFTVRLLEPVSGRVYENAFRAQAVLQVPPGEKLAELSFFLNDQLVGRMSRPPFVLPLHVMPEPGPYHMRVLARLESGQTVEDSVLFQSEDPLYEVDVRHMRLWVQAERKGKPVTDLSKEQFQLFEDGEEKHIGEFETGENLPIQVSFVVDTSESMYSELAFFAKRAGAFMNNIVRKQDQFSLSIFKDTSKVIVPMTSNSAKLMLGMKQIERREVQARGQGTALYNAIVDAIFQLSGRPGQHAIILFTDGNDTTSSYNSGHVMRYAHQTNVRIFSVVVPRNHSHIVSKSALQMLGRETGGGYFEAKYDKVMHSVFQEIEAILRGQYLLGYETIASDQEDPCRKVEVKLPKGYVVKTQKKICL